MSDIHAARVVGKKNQGRIYATPTPLPLLLFVIPAKAGIHFRLRLFASSFGRLYSRMGRIGIEHKTKDEFSELRIQTPRDNKVVAAPLGEKSKWIPAFAGMTVG